MRRYIGMFLMAVAGGAFALFANHMINKNRFAGFSQNQNVLPVYQTDFRSSPPLTGADFVLAAEMSVHAVAHVKTEYQRKNTEYDLRDFYDPFRDLFGMTPQQRLEPQPIKGAGSGVIISDDGYIVTNNHVVQDVDFIEVTLNNKKTYTAKVIGTDPSTDLALIKIDGQNLPFIRYGNSDSLKVGEWVLAVGNPFNLTSTVTAGIVSAKARNINILRGGASIESFIQTDAAVNRGNSGGALVSVNGDLLGINTAIASQNGYYTGYSFAIPVNLVKKVMEDLLKYGEVQRAYLGIIIKEIDDKLAREKGLKDPKGVYIDSIITDGSADEAGLRQGDVIIEVNGTKINSSSKLLEIIGQYRPGERVQLTYTRGNNVKEVTVVLKNKENTEKLIAKSEKSISKLLGATFESVPASEKSRLGISDGVKVIKLEGGKLRSAGIREGFIITSIDKKTVKTPEDIENALKDKKGGVLIEGIYPNGMRAYYGFGL